MRNFFLLFSVLFYASTLGAQTLVNIGPAEVSVPEFLWAYNKSNQAEQSANGKNIRLYLDLYINFRMKVLDAEAQGLDKEQAFKEELEGYRNRLADRYLLDREVSDKLVSEAYQRSLKIINASHILILCVPDAPSSDTLRAFQKISSIRDQALAGTPFDELAATYSEEPGSTERKGYLGDFSVFQMVYAFENAAYQTPKGSISAIVRSRFGYHIIKVHDIKPNPGQVEVAHIFVAVPENTEENVWQEAKAKSDEIHKSLKLGADFDLMARQFSDDKISASNGGVLQILTSGQSDKALDEAAFALNKPGEISAPIKTPHGWHIIRLIRKIPVPTFNLAKGQLKNQMANNERSVLGHDVFISRLKNQYHFTEDASIKNSPDALEAKLSSPDKNGNDLLFSFSNKKVFLTDFLKFIALNKQDGQSTDELYSHFVQQELTSFENLHLGEKYPEFRYLLNEYRNGILLFNLSEQKIWNLAPGDSVKLQEFYESRADIYRWKERADARVYMAGKAEDIVKIKEMIKQNKTDQEILSVLNKTNPLNLVINAGPFERGSHLFVDRAKWQSSTNTEINVGNAFALVRVNKVLPPTVKPYAEVEEILLADYMEHLEKQWLKELKLKYPVRIDQAELKKISR